MINLPASSANDIIKVGVLAVEEPRTSQNNKSNAPFHRRCVWKADKDASVQQRTADLHERVESETVA